MHAGRLVLLLGMLGLASLWRSALIVGLHGRTGTGADFEAQSNLDATADRETFAIAYPDGLVDAVGTTNWYYFYDPFYINPPDDVGFVRGADRFPAG
ncbi:MAG: Esterase depolymerase [Gammaproteobacteria bacterium]|nr:Esterase depolymerase [Gammaproteobacteria bacterium]